MNSKLLTAAFLAGSLAFSACLAALLIVGAATTTAAAQTRPFDQLEASRRQRIETDKRMTREAAEQRKKDKEGTAAGARDAAAQRSASQPPLPREPSGPKRQP